MDHLQPTDTYAEIVEAAQDVSPQNGMDTFRVVRQIQLDYEARQYLLKPWTSDGDGNTDVDKL